MPCIEIYKVHIQLSAINSSRRKTLRKKAVSTVICNEVLSADLCHELTYFQNGLLLSESLLQFRVYTAAVLLNFHLNVTIDDLNH